MIPQSFEYHVPRTLEEASRLAAQFGADGKFLAGGHSLIPMMKLRLAAPKHLIDLTCLRDLAYIREEGEHVRIGALTTHFRIESSALLKEKCPLLPETAREIGDVQVRNRGTIGGNLAHSDPAADWPAAVLALEAELRAVSPRGERGMAAKDFFVDLMTTALASDEVLVEIKVPQLGHGTGAAYAKLHHPASGYAMVGVAAVIALRDNGAVERAAVGITGVGPKAYRAFAVETALHGKPATQAHLNAAAAHAAEGVDVNADLYASAEYRSHLARVYTRRALEAAVKRARAAATA